MHRNVHDITGRVFGKLTAISFVKTVNGDAFWLFRCDCGKERITRAMSVKSGETRSCGCLRAPASTKHGHKPSGRPTPTYSAWNSMITRCTNPKAHSYSCYGGRGIKICERWLKFENFLADMGVRPDNLSLDRINNEGDYEPGNCRWATQAVQSSNKRTNVYLTMNGVTHTMAQWGIITGMSRQTIRSRLRYGWPVEKILTKPIRKRKNLQ